MVMRKLLVLAILLLAVPTLAGETEAVHGSGEMLTLEQAVALGLERNLDIRIARRQEEISRIDRGRGRAAMLPDLTLSGGYQLGWHDLDSNTPGALPESESEQLSGNVALSWTIFDGLEMFTTRRRYNQLAVKGEYQLRAAIEKEIVSISLAYRNLALQRQLLTAATDNLAVSEIRLEQNRVRRDLGGVSETDLLLAQVASNTDRSAWLEQQLQSDRALRELNLLLGGDEGNQLQVAAEIPLPDLELDDQAVIARVLDSNSALKLAEQGAVLAGYDVSSARSAYWPRLALNSGWAYNDRTVSGSAAVLPVDMLSESRDLSVGLTLSMSLFDGFQKRMNLQKARAGERIAGLNEEKTRRDLRSQVSDLLSTYRQQLVLVELARNNETAAGRSLSLHEQLASSGAATSLEFRDAQLSLNRARSSHLLARFQAWTTYTRIRQLQGLLLE
jgi:outer membrane protein